jgi:uridine kinase
MMAEVKGPIVLGITGPSSATKTFIAKSLLKHLKATRILHVDDYWEGPTVYPKNKLKLKNWEKPDMIHFEKLRKDVLLLKKKKKYNFIIVEGVLLFYYKKMRDILDVKVFITLPQHLIVKRRLERFGHKDEQEWYSRNVVIKEYKRYGEPTKKYADLVIKGTDKIHENIKRVKRALK